jgi:hypothetical protein
LHRHQLWSYCAGARLVSSCTTREVVCRRMTEWLMESLRKDATEADMAYPAPVGSGGGYKAFFRHTRL